jgi:acyl-CoA synthetase (AMP-forming)/AMP-acid ligase II
VDYTPGCFDKNYSRAAVDVGYPFPGVTVGVFDPDGNELGYGERGEIRIKTDSMTTGYINDPEYTQAKLKDGWLLTEDCGELDERGKLFVYGRMSQHLLAPGGEKVYLFDIANLLREDPAVKDALVCRLETEHGPLVAHVVLEDNIPDTEEDVLRRLDARVSAFLPAGLRMEGYRTERGQLRSNLVGKTDRVYYSNLLTGYRTIQDGLLGNMDYSGQK